VRRKRRSTDAEHDAAFFRREAEDKAVNHLLDIAHKHQTFSTAELADDRGQGLRAVIDRLLDKGVQSGGLQEVSPSVFRVVDEETLCDAFLRRAM
jgi:hypothetical protein